MIKICKTYEVRDDYLVIVRRYLVEGAHKYDYPKIYENIEACGEYVMFAGKERDSASVVGYLLTGKWGNPVLKIRRD